jgi:hypothetical protein
LLSSRSFSLSGYFLHAISTNEYWSTLFIPNIYSTWCNKQVLWFWFVSSNGHILSFRTSFKLFTKSRSNICITMVDILYSCTLFLMPNIPL